MSGGVSAAACTRCQTPLEDGDLRCAVCALVPPQAPDAPSAARASVQILRCTECGAAIAYDANRQAPACGFCGAVMTIEQPADPVEVAALRVPFAIDRGAAQAALRGWLGARGFFAPKALREEAVIDSMQPLGWAAWIVTAHADVAWTADSDAGSRRSSWAPHAGVESLELGNIVVPASRGLSSREAFQLIPHYALDQISAPPFGGAARSGEAGAFEHAVPVGAAEPGELVEGFDVQRSAARAHVHAAIEEVAKARIAPAIPGRRHRNVHVSCVLQRQTTARVALPAWVLAYRYRGSPYRAIVHGQRADVVCGTSPTDWAKVALTVVAVAAALAAIALAILWMHE